MRTGLTAAHAVADAELLRDKFEALARDSYGFKRSRKGTYKNPVVARDWKWFQAGYKVCRDEEAQASTSS